MKKTQFTDLITTIRKTAVSFTAIAVFIAFGLAFYGGITWTADHMEESFTGTYREGHMQTLLVTAPLGLTGSRIAELKTVDGVDEAEGCTIVYRFFQNKSGIRQQAVLLQMTESINRLMNVEGRLPEAAGEAAALRSWAEENGASVGDVIVLDDRELTLTALVDSPVYLSVNPYAHGVAAANGLYVDAVFYVTGKENWPEAFGGCNAAVLFSDELNRMNCFGEEYKVRSKELCDAVQRTIDGWGQQAGAVSSQTGLISITETNVNNSYLVADNLISILYGMRSVLGIAFLAIGVLICYSVVSRLVSDAAVQIGTRKALGFFRREILRLYLCYVGAALLLGGILGVLIGVFGIESAFTKVFTEQFTFTAVPLICHLTDILPVYLIICGILMAVTAAACAGKTGMNVIALLQNENGLTGSHGWIRRLRIFQKQSLLNQTVLLNLLRDRRRVFGMLIGIGGAAALISAGLTFYLNFINAFSKQFTEYYRFDWQVCYDASSDTASGEIRRVLDRHGLQYAEVYSSCLILYTPDGKTNAPTVLVPADPQELSEIMFFETETEKNTAFDRGVWMSDYYRYSFDAPEGSLLELKTLGGRKAELPVDCYYRYHLSTPVAVMDQDTYREAFGEEAAPNAFYVASGGMEMKELCEELEEIGGYIYTFNFYESFSASFSSEQAVLSAFAVLFITMAVLMELMILINQLNVYISEKKNELIILMINGYDAKFAKSYIYQDTVFLTAAGILAGLITGSILGEQTLISVEGTSARMIHGISRTACVTAAAVTAALTVLICVRALKKVDRFRLSDINNG